MLKNDFETNSCITLYYRFLENILLNLSKCFMQTACAKGNLVDLSAGMLSYCIFKSMCFPISRHQELLNG